MSTDRYAKHQRSKHKRYVCTLIDGTQVSADTQKELRKKVSDVRNIQNKKSVSPVKPQYDPDTGDRIN